MQLRFLNRKLQSNSYVEYGIDKWIDVPTVDETPKAFIGKREMECSSDEIKPQDGKVWWCEHIKYSKRHLSWIGKSGNSMGLGCADEFNYCPICGTKRPVEQTIEDEFCTVIRKSMGGYGNCLFPQDAKTMARNLIDFLKSKGLMK